MNPLSDTVLAIAPYSKGIGVAVFEGDSLVKFDLKHIKSPRKFPNIEFLVKTVFRNEVKWYDPDVVVIKAQPRNTKDSTHFDAAFITVLKETAKFEIPLQIVSLQEGKQFLCPNEKVNEVNVMKELCKSYPELNQYQNLPTKDQKDYNRPLLAAIIIGFYQKSTISNE